MTDESDNKVKAPRGKHANSLANLKPFTPEGQRLAQARSVQARMLNKQLREEFKRNAKAFSKILDDIPNLSSLDVIRMCIHMALQENNYEDAARWAKELAEYEKPKLQRIEQTISTKKDISDSELKELLEKEGLSGYANMLQ